MMGNREGAEEGLTFAFRFTDATISIPNQGMVNFAPAVPFFQTDSQTPTH